MICFIDFPYIDSRWCVCGGGGCIICRNPFIAKRDINRFKSVVLATVEITGIMNEMSV